MATTKKGATTIDPVVTYTYTNMLLYAFFFLLLVNPVVVLSRGQDQEGTDAKRAAVEDVKTKSTMAPKPPQDSQQDKSNQIHGSASNQNSKHATVSTTPSSGKVNCSLPKYVNSTFCKNDDEGMVNFFLKKMSSNSGMLFRTMYVLLAVTGVVIVYFVIKAVRVRRRKSKSRKYGIITKQGDHGDMEMEPLGDGADEDDDYTVFEMSRRK